MSRRTPLRRLLLSFFLCLSLSLLLPLQVHADPETDALIDEIMELSGAKAEVLDAVISTTQQGMLAGATDDGMPPRAAEILVEEVGTVMREIFADPRVWAGAREAYSSIFTVEELVELRDFYRSEVARKLVRSMPQISETMMRYMLPVIREYQRDNPVMRRAVPRLLEEGLINQQQADAMLAGDGG